MCVVARVVERVWRYVNAAALLRTEINARASFLLLICWRALMAKHSSRLSLEVATRGKTEGFNTTAAWEKSFFFPLNVEVNYKNIGIEENV